MKIEHIGYMMEDPAKAADWYVEHLGFKIVRSGDAPAHARFLADSEGESIIEIYNNPDAQVPDYPQMDPLILHLAVKTDDVPGKREELLAAGATAYKEIDHLDNGDILAIVRDPWGFPLQLANRGEAMI